MKKNKRKLFSFHNNGYYASLTLFSLNIMLTDNTLRIGRWVLTREPDVRQDGEVKNLEEQLWK